ncbi:MAG: hypothetical protein R2834_18580 [Rhodothermales bacterium]
MTAPGRLHVAMLLLAGVLFAACEDSFIDPYANDERYYTLYGYLDESKNFQPGTLHAIRVIPITRSSQRILEPSDPNAQIDAAVYSIDLETGQEVRWGYSLEQLADGSYGHVFQTRFFVKAATSYRLEVRRSDGMVASAETHVPATSGIFPVIDEPALDATDGSLYQDIRLPDVRSLWDVDIVYQLGDRTCFAGSPNRVSYGRVGVSTDEGWRIRINLTDDVRSLEARLGSTDWRVCSIGIRTRIMDNQWTPPGDVFDPETLALPASLSNVEHGYGYFGSLGLFQHDWLLSEANSNLLGH